MAPLPDRVAPELEPGVTVDSLATVEACDRALDRLTMAIAHIERQLATTPRNSPNQPADWRANAEAALRIKRFLMPRLQERRADLKRRARADRQTSSQAAQLARADLKRRTVVRLLWDTEPEAARRVEALAHQRFPDLFPGDGESAR